MNTRYNPTLTIGLLLLPGLAFLKFYLFIESSSKALGAYTEVFHQSFLLLSVLILLGMVWKRQLRPVKDPPLRRKLPLAWGSGFVTVVFLELFLVIYVNPHARFAPTRFPSITPATRLIKTELYREIQADPKIVILGSSRAFTLSPAYIEDKVGHETFNMSVEGGRAGDFTIQLKYMLTFSTIPELLIVEVSPATLNRGFQNISLQPLTLIPYMHPATAISAVGDTLKDGLGLQSISDSMYLLQFDDVRNQQAAWTFDQTGLGLYKEPTHEEYVELLDFTIRQRLKQEQCTHLHEAAKSELEGMIRLARENGISVLLYRSPMHAAFYAASRGDSPAQFDACSLLLETYLQSLEEYHENVFFHGPLDRRINAMEETGFYDAVHLRPAAANLVIDALADDIEDAVHWTTSESP